MNSALLNFMVCCSSYFQTYFISFEFLHQWVGKCGNTLIEAVEGVIVELVEGKQKRGIRSEM